MRTILPTTKQTVRGPGHTYLSATLRPNDLFYPLLLIAFITGLLDSTTYADFGVFASNQTGNTVVFSVGLLKTKRVQFVDVAVSLSTFLVTVFVVGQLGNVFGTRKRWWILINSTMQTALTFLVAILLKEGVIVPENGDTNWVVLLLLAGSAGAQIAMAKQFHVPEVPTAMLTSPFADLLVDPRLFSPWKTNEKRNRRVLYIASIVAGTVVGAAIHKYANTYTAVFIGAGVRSSLIVWFSVLKAEPADQKPGPCT